MADQIQQIEDECYRVLDEYRRTEEDQLRIKSEWNTKLARLQVDMLAVNEGDIQYIFDSMYSLVIKK